VILVFIIETFNNVNVIGNNELSAGYSTLMKGILQSYILMFYIVILEFGCIVTNFKT
jgi:hypothetical protein